MSSGSSEQRRLVAERLLAQLRRTPGEAECGVDRRLVGRVRQRLERGDVGGRAGRSHQRGPEAAPARRRRARSAPRRPSRPRARRASCSIMATICGSSAKRDSTDAGSGAAQTTASSSGLSRQRRTSPAGSPSSAAAMPPTSSRARATAARAAVADRPRARARRGVAPRSSARSPARSAAGRPPPLRAARRRCGLQRARDLDRALRPQPEIATESDETGRELALELRQLGDLARLDELAQPRLDAPADPAQLAHATGPHELGHRDRRPTDRLGGAPVRPRRVGVRLGELEQRRKGLQPVRDPCVVHPRQSSRMRTAFAPRSRRRRPGCSAAQPAPRA